MHELPLEFRKDPNLLNIVASVGQPLKIDPLTSSLYHDSYTRVLVDIDFSQPLIERILARMRDEDNRLDFNFFVGILHEKLVNFYTLCKIFNHATPDCRKGSINHLNKGNGNNGKQTTLQNGSVTGAGIVFCKPAGRAYNGGSALHGGKELGINRLLASHSNSSSQLGRKGQRTVLTDPKI